MDARKTIAVQRAGEEEPCDPSLYENAQRIAYIASIDSCQKVKLGMTIWLLRHPSKAVGASTMKELLY